MRIMQVMREKYKIPPEEIRDVIFAIFGRMLNESCYAIGSNIRPDYPIDSFFTKDHILNLIKVLNGEELRHDLRSDIDTDIQRGLLKFKEFIIKNASDFYIKE
jgi:hypothetical protein